MTLSAQDGLRRELTSKELVSFSSPEGKEELRRQANLVSEHLHRIICYLFDYRIELMNSLLGAAFGHQFPRRKPLDPRYVVLIEVAIKEGVERAEEERLRRAMQGTWSS